jgi:hypothetical protein
MDFIETIEIEATPVNTMRELPDLEQTLGDLILDLLRARVEYPELVLAAPLDGHGKFSLESVRVTQHYTMALLAYGYTPSQVELQEAARWFSIPFPTETQRRIDSAEMNRLEVLLSLQPQNPYVLPRLEQLALQRTPNDYFDIQAADPVFETLWALKVMAQARDAGVLNGIISDADLRQRTAKIMQGNHREKDLALAIRLRHDLSGRLTPAQQKRYLDKLIEVAAKGGGMWGLSQDTRWIVDNMWRQQLTTGQVADHRDTFREMIISTCYVIENLLPLTESYPQIEQPLRQAMELWWGIFHGGKAVDILRALFPNAYDYLLILCRTLVSVRAYVGQPLIYLGAAHIHRTLASQQARRVEPPDSESIKKALKNWIHVDLEKAPEQLRLGMSDTNVVRIHPRITNPMQPEDDSFRLLIPNADSLVVKYGPIEEIDRERENYAKLPNSIRDAFVNIPQPSYVDDERRRAFVIMADLNRYRTLSDALLKVPQMHEALIHELGPFLIRVHLGDVRVRRGLQEGLLLQLYLLPMQQHTRRIFSYVLENKLLEADKQKYANQLQRTLLDVIGNLVRHQLELEDFPLACMHGDLHTRNIMVRRLKRSENPERDNEIDFKLIDLEKFRRSGDAALDAGELLVDMELLRAPRNVASDRDPMVTMMKSLDNLYTGFAEEREDSTFPVRLELAQARALIRVAKGRTKQGDISLRESRKGPAIRIAFDVLNDAEAALKHLEKVMAALE